MARRVYTLDDHLEESFNDPAFRKAWDESEVEYQISRSIIQMRLKAKMTQGELAKKARTTQVVISRIENMSGNPTIELLSRIAQAFGLRMRVSFE